ncbi:MULTISPECIES: discoidin domain-containing protein [unclassified Lentimonas]|uniref:discoidin domain-containing protein n=1 Tax=unclassified Lentimonas TaxID=2630993 RepID=UPI001389E74E|nr:MULTISPECIES: discoidin domain-containing protein [unclassified Lentimonas]
MLLPNIKTTLTAMLLAGVVSSAVAGSEPINISGVYPHLAMYNQQGECGTGAVVPWAGKLWAITYAPHWPFGSTDKLYEITPDLEQIIRPESIGGTPANRMIHKESNQLFIGPYAISVEGDVRVISVKDMPGRHTGNARHLTDPAGKIYYATMEEGLYSVDVDTLEVEELIMDGNLKQPLAKGVVSRLPGYHGKGLYSGQGRVVYSNNGQKSAAAKKDPTTPSGALAQWFGEGDWQLVRRNQFTELTGPNGIYGSNNPETDPIWGMGWDMRSVLIGLLEDGEWSYYRLPKGSHSYDGAHGWNTEWPRIREIGETDFLATMHGTFWRFPATFSKANSAGIAPRSNYLKVIGDFAKWQDKLVLGCDDSAKNEFLNTRSFKAKHAAPKQSNSNFWFIEAEQLDEFGPVIGRGSVWLRDDVQAKTASDPYLFSGYDYRQLTLTHSTDLPVTFTLEVDEKGTGEWTELMDITLESKGREVAFFNEDATGVWIRIVTDVDATDVTAHFQYRDRDTRSLSNDPLFTGIATPEKPAATTGLMRSLSYKTLGLATADGDYYELNSEMEFVTVDDDAKAAQLIQDTIQPANAYRVDAASTIVVEGGKRYRLPKSDRYLSEQRKAASTQNLALGASVTPSSIFKPKFAAANAVDGNRSEDSRWVSANEGDKWIELDLGEPKEFRTVQIVSGWKQDAAYVVKHLAVQSKQDGDWKTIPGAEVNKNNSVDLVINLPTSVTAQHIRLLSNDKGHVRIYEVALMNASSGGQNGVLGAPRVCREVATERDLFNLHGTFYELPARNAQGMAKIRPVATHNMAIFDYCSHAGLLFFTGIDADSSSDHIFRSTDGKAAVWAGVVDDLWKLGKPHGQGGPWKDSAVKAGVPSDPYLMTAYDQKRVELSATADSKITLEVDIDGTNLWVPYQSFDLKTGETISHTFPEGFSAYWVRAISDRDATATAWFVYE